MRTGTTTEGLKPIDHLQMGFGGLPAAGRCAHMRILRQWLSHCDAQHTCRLSLATQLPRRLIDVGSVTISMVRLYETKPDDNLNYIALSHDWGKGPYFHTTLAKIAEHRHHINFETLPKTYQDAITVTRELNVRYLWIDSICVIQDLLSDRDIEARQREDVFSQAYCVLAATAASGQHDGFLKHREEPEFSIHLKAPGSKSGIRICKFIDDFDQHVLQSPLHQKARTLQERALARRTIYFTDVQTFWECGSGVRCETMTKMNKYGAPLSSEIG